MKISGEEAEKLIIEAEACYPDSDFISSLWDWFEEKGFITERQAEVLQKIIDRD